jgi:thiol-disulfide isomerase/thioredoxin
MHAPVRDFLCPLTAGSSLFIVSVKESLWIWKSLVLFITALALAGACVSGEKKGGGAAQSAPDFTLEDLDGRNVTLSGLKGKVVLLDFWATWCPPCRASIPSVEQLHKTYGARGLVVVGISLDGGDWDSVKEFRNEAGITYPVLKGTEEVAQQYLVRTIPAFVIVDKEGIIRKRYIGSDNEEEIEKEIKALL